MPHIFCRLEYYTQPVSCLPLYLIQCATGRLLITLLLSHGAHHNEILSVSWSYPPLPPWGSSPRIAKTSTNLSFPKRLQDTLTYNSVLEGIPRIIVRGMKKKTGKRSSKGYEQTLPPRSNLPGISVMLQNSFIVISNKSEDIGVYLFSNCYHLHMTGYTL